MLRLLLMMDVPVAVLSRGCVSSHTGVALPFLQTGTIGSSFKVNHSKLKIVQCAMLKLVLRHLVASTPKIFHTV
jgi:hypothetical protein